MTNNDYLFPYQLTEEVPTREHVLYAIKQLEKYGDKEDRDFQVRVSVFGVSLWTKGKRSGKQG